MKKDKKIIVNLGCGTVRLPNSIGVDRVKIKGFVDKVHDLDKVPYPFKSNSVDEIHMYHVLEHLQQPIKKMEEIHRILKPKGKIYIRVPHFSSMGAFSDITHVRPFGYTSFDCFQKDDYHHFYTNVEFKIVEKRIKYLGLYPNSGDYAKYVHPNQCPVWARPFVLLLNKMIDISPIFFERVWCFSVGGATELVVTLEKVK
jgi:SAM-dependent methyltransferase